MKKIFAIIAAVSVAFFSASAQNQVNTERYIDVIGSAEMYVVPDEIHYEITLKEYFAEEFKKGAKPEDYKTKVPMEKIEKEFREALYSVGVAPEDIRVKEVGDYWRSQGKDFQISKRFDIKLTDYNMIDKINSVIDTRGVKYMNIGELKNGKIQEYKKECRINAVKAAREKASYLLKALGENLGRVISISDNSYSPDVTYQAKASLMAMDMAPREENVAAEDGFALIKISFSINVRFAIAD